VTTFLYVRSYQAERARADAADAAKGEADSGLRNAQTDANNLKRILGFADADTMALIDGEVAVDMQTYGATFNEATQSYRKLVKYLHDELQKANESAAIELAKRQAAEIRNERLEAAKEPQIQQEKSRADAAVADRDKERTEHNANRTAIQQQNQDLQTKLAETRTTADQQLASASAEVASVQAELKRTTSIKDGVLEQYRQLTEPTFEVPDGKVRWVNQRQGTVWINLGEADALDRLTSFAVYSSDASDVGNTVKKASIEVIQLDGPHLAQARIVEDNPADPIMPGDLVHTPVWTPGQREHFALLDGIDINGDKKTDLDMIRNLITSNGGEVDFYLTDAGQPSGEMTTQTKYIVQGKEPGVNAEPKLLEAHTAAVNEAKRLGIRQIPVPELLARMGWKSQTPVATFGPGASAADFPVPPPEGLQKKSIGNVSEFFRDRQPPANPPRTAY
jgi:hypothetical protein